MALAIPQGLKPHFINGRFRHDSSRALLQNLFAKDRPNSESSFLGKWIKSCPVTKLLTVFGTSKLVPGHLLPSKRAIYVKVRNRALSNPRYDRVRSRSIPFPCPGGSPAAHSCYVRSLRPPIRPRRPAPGSKTSPCRADLPRRGSSCRCRA